jgi:hypothetical protein
MVHTSDADRVNSLDPDKMGLPHNQFAIGRNPYNAAAFAGHRALRAYWVDRLPRLLKDAFRETILAYYDAQRISLGRSDFQVFAEKTHTDPELRGGIHFLFPEAKEILLIRDPRDLLCSYSNFFQTPQATAIDLISGHLHCIMESRSREDILFVKYEDLVIDLPATLQRVCEYLELSRSDGMLKDEGVFGMHGTSKTPHSSIGRWREELGSDWTIPLNWKPFLSVFDYDL